MCRTDGLLGQASVAVGLVYHGIWGRACCGDDGGCTVQGYRQGPSASRRSCMRPRMLSTCYGLFPSSLWGVSGSIIQENYPTLCYKPGRSLWDFFMGRSESRQVGQLGGHQVTPQQGIVGAFLSVPKRRCEGRCLNSLLLQAAISS